MPAKGKIILILGGARSGKSTFAQHLAETMSTKVLFVATAQPLDEEMKNRIEIHRKNRPASWRTLEAPTNISKTLHKLVSDAEVVIVDCLTILVANILGDNPNKKTEKEILDEMKTLIDYMNTSRQTFIIVSNELGLGVVPENKLARIYRDLLGIVNQIIAHEADEVYFLTAGIPLAIKNNKNKGTKS